MKPALTYELAHAAATDAGNRWPQDAAPNAPLHYGQPWTYEAYRAAVRELDKLYPPESPS